MWFFKVVSLLIGAPLPLVFIINWLAQNHYNRGVSKQYPRGIIESIAPSFVKCLEFRECQGEEQISADTDGGGHPGRGHSYSLRQWLFVKQGRCYFLFWTDMHIGICWWIASTLVWLSTIRSWNLKDMTRDHASSCVNGATAPIQKHRRLSLVQYTPPTCLIRMMQEAPTWRQWAAVPFCWCFDLKLFSPQNARENFPFHTDDSVQHTTP